MFWIVSTREKDCEKKKEKADWRQRHVTHDRGLNEYEQHDVVSVHAPLAVGLGGKVKNVIKISFVFH